MYNFEKGDLVFGNPNFVLDQIVYDRVTDRSRGFAFITMASVQEAKDAIRMFNGSVSGILPITTFHIHNLYRNL